MRFKIGQIIKHRDCIHGSFYMIMGRSRIAVPLRVCVDVERMAFMRDKLHRREDHYIMGSILGYESIKTSLHPIPCKYVDENYEPYVHKVGGIVAARLDNEIMRRLNYLYENNSPSDVYGHRFYRSKKKHLL